MISQLVFSTILLMTSLSLVTPSSYVVETVVFVDKSGQERWSKMTQQKVDVESGVRSMMLEVNKIYKGLKKDYDMDVRIHLKELVLLKQDVTSPSLDLTIDADYATGRFHFYLTDYQDRKYDLALLLTGQLLYGASIFGARGIANIGAICTDRSLAVITLDPTPHNIYVIAHEIGHVLGARHDGDLNNCDPKNKYLMIYSLLTTPNRYKFSSCSQFSIHQTLTYYGECLKNNQDVKDPEVPRFGALMSIDDMCKAYYGTESYFARKYYRKGYGDDICLRITCVKKNTKTGQLTAYYKPSADGLFCAKNKQCIKGKCVKTAAGLSTVSDTCPFGDQSVINGTQPSSCSQVTPSQCSSLRYQTICCQTCGGHSTV